jgi:serine phosphatase RsbU (regulator of sigma subunit)
MALAIYNRTTRELHFAGANNPLYLFRETNQAADPELQAYTSIRNNDYQLYVFKGDKQPIGTHWEERSFTNHSVRLRENDSFYIFSDGYVDQFGGEQRKKFKSTNFKRLLLSLQDKSMDYQKRILEDTFEAWKGDVEQIDDVSVIGLRV